jgi:hypothetical protein
MTRRILNRAMNKEEGRIKIEQKPLKDFTNGELMLFLENNENEDPKTLAWICSECLRRIMQGTYGMSGESNETK